MSVEWAKLRAAELRALAAEDAIVVVPVASIEQHGPHLPVQTDTLLCSEVCRRAAEEVAKTRPIVVSPCVWSGLSEHHMPFGGTLSLDFQAFFGLLRGVLRSLQRHGFRRVALINGHGGNIAALRVVVDELSPEMDLHLATATYWPCAEVAFAEILERQPGVHHACEAETAMVMAVAPELVDLARLDEAEAGATPSRASAEGLYRWRSFAARSKNGVIGHPAAASAAKGERLLEAATTGLAAALLDESFWQAPARPPA
jgi:creatinine amidohydrolase